MQYKIILKTLKEKKSKINEEEINKDMKLISKEKSDANNFLFNSTNTAFSCFSNQTKEKFCKFITE